MADNRITTPTSSAGLMRFYDVSSSNVQLDPKVVVAFAIAVIVIELVLRL
ncbi:MAG: preprotein translocase subunit Sec61beta [Candidatus Micrarchaeia archaeon]